LAKRRRLYRQRYGWPGFLPTAITERTATTPHEPSAAKEQIPEAEIVDPVTLNQAAAIAHKSKRTLENYRTAGTHPAPYFEGGGGKAALYDWRVMRPWLMKTFGIPLPEKFPRLRQADRNA
jgi:hypothetical protein